MKEDKLDKEIAASLKEKLAEASVPYELGAWEGFQKKRALRKRKSIAYWASGIAASLLLLALGLNTVDFSENRNADSTGNQIAESEEKATENKVEELSTSNSNSENSPSENILDQESSLITSDSNALAEVDKDQKPQKNLSSTKALATVPQREEKTEEKEKDAPQSSVVSPEKTVAQVEEKQTIEQQPLVAKTEEPDMQLVEKLPEGKLALAKPEEPVKPEEKENFVVESDFPAIEKDKPTVGLGMGLSPGFGSIQSDNQVATASTIGLGMLVDIKLPGKFTLGSGLGLNYLSQNTEQESTIMAFGNSYPQTEKLELRQMQVEVPVFIKYPLTKNNSISVQAGFSNFYALNERGSQENSYDRQVAQYSNDAAGFSSVSLSNKSMNTVTSLEPTESKFYPFATVNFGLNLRVLESKNASYVIMPFYNYQLKQVSGYGDTFGLFGASFKMSFGGREK